MIKLKHIIAFFLASGILAGLAFFLNAQDKMFLNRKIAELSSGSLATEEITDEQDSIPFEKKLQDELKIISASYSKRSKRNIWTLARGKTIVVYLMQAQKFIQKRGGSILWMEELSDNPNSYQSARVDVLTPKRDTLHLTLQVSENIFMKNASLMSIAFQTTSLSSEIIAKLNNLDFPFDLLVPPFGLNDDFYKDLNKIRNKEIVLWLAMESTKLNKVHNKLRPLRIHHTAEQIEETISTTFTSHLEARRKKIHVVFGFIHGRTHGRPANLQRLRNQLQSRVSIQSRQQFHRGLRSSKA